MLTWHKVSKCIVSSWLFFICDLFEHIECPTTSLHATKVKKHISFLKKIALILPHF